MFTPCNRFYYASCLVSLIFLLMLIGLDGNIGNKAGAAELNLYSSRHYDSDELLYKRFEQKTGITINRIEDKADLLIQRLKAEGRNSPGDILITVDAGRLWHANQEDLFQPVRSARLEERIPEHLRHPQGYWFGFSMRARMIFYVSGKIAPVIISDYESLAAPKLRGKVCTRSSSNIYMLSLLASIIAHNGMEKARYWAQGVWDNRARDPAGGDTDQLRGLISGACEVVLANSYYFARALRRPVKGLDQTALNTISWVFPNQAERGTHVNISGAGLLKHAPNRQEAITFLEYLTSDEAQADFSAGNDEYPVVQQASRSPSVAKLGEFRADRLHLSKLGEYQAQAQRLYDEIGYR